MENVAYARALAAAFSADLSIPAIADAVQNGGLSKQQFERIVRRDVAKGITGESGPALFPSLRAFARQQVDIAAIKHARVTTEGVLSGLGMDTSLIGGLSSLGGAIAGAVGAIWGAKIETNAAKQLAKIRLQEAQIVENSQSIALKSALIQNATANGLHSNADGQPIDPSTGEPLSEIGAAAQAKVAGVPTWGIAVGAAAAVVGGIYAFSN